MNQDGKWDLLRESLREASDREGVHWDEDEMQSAIREAYLAGINPGIVLSCREACESQRQFVSELRNLISSGKRILAVDDEEDFLDLVKLNLEKVGYLVRTVSDAREALAVAREFRPNLLLLDIVMPHMDGLELLKALREEPTLGRTPVILLTALAEDVSQGGVARDGVLYLAKPIAFKKLLHCIEQHLQIREG